MGGEVRGGKKALNKMGRVVYPFKGTGA